MRSPSPSTIDVAELLQGLSQADAQSVLQMTQDHTYPKGMCIFRADEPQQGLYLVKRGLVEEFRLTEQGERLPINRLGPGRLLAMASRGGNYCCFAEAVEESVVGFLSFQALENICARFPRVAVNLVTVLARRLGETEERLELLASRDLRGRVAGVLLMLWTTHGQRPLSITHEALAQWVAGSRPKVSILLEELRKAGLIRLARGKIEILDPSGLEQWAREEAEKK